MIGSADPADRIIRELRELQERRLDAGPAAREVIIQRTDLLLARLWELLPEWRRIELREEW